MAKRSLTLLEIHLGDGDVRIGPNRLLGESDDDVPEISSAADGHDATASDSSIGCCSGKSMAIALLVIGFLAVVGFAAARLLGGEELDDATALDALDE